MLYQRTVGRTSLRPREVAILLPALNEEAALGNVLDQIPIENLRASGYDPLVMIVDGHSIDRTAEVAANRGASVLAQDGVGKGWAVRTGMAAITSDYTVMLDADDTYPAARIPEFLYHLDSGADVVVGSRFQGTIESGAMSSLNFLGNKMLSFLASTLYGQEISDVCSGMWAFGPRARNALRMNSIGFEVEAEMFAQSVKRGLRIREIPIEYRRRTGRAKLQSVRTGVRIAAKLVRKRFTP